MVAFCTLSTNSLIDISPLNCVVPEPSAGRPPTGKPPEGRSIGGGSVFISSVTCVELVMSVITSGEVLEKAYVVMLVYVIETYRTVVDKSNVHHRLEDTIFDLVLLI